MKSRTRILTVLLMGWEEAKPLDEVTRQDKANQPPGIVASRRVSYPQLDDPAWEMETWRKLETMLRSLPPQAVQAYATLKSQVGSAATPPGVLPRSPRMPEPGRVLGAE